jgi:uncharacterized caspase-like protein
LTNEQVDAAHVTRAFTEVASQVRGRPQDTVVVFIAGHTGVFDGDRFCLLLPSFPFAQEAPQLVALRGAALDPEPGAELGPGQLLPYALIAQNLSRLDALNRLVIVDACQAGAILSDPKVTAIRKWMEIGSRRARTSYLMAARRGEPALEVDPLGHGLFTFTLLRGMKGVDPAQEPREVARLDLRPDADFDGDGILTTLELDVYVKQTMPRIAAQFPAMVAQVRAARNLPAADDRLDQDVHIQDAPVSFPLIALPDVSSP